MILGRRPVHGGLAALACTERWKIIYFSAILARITSDILGRVGCRV